VSSSTHEASGISIEDLVVDYGEHRAVDHVSFAVRPGSVVALLGPNGAGKTSTVRCVVGLQAPTAGRVTVAGHDVARDPEGAKARLGYVPEHGSLYNTLTPRETLLLKGRLHHMSDEQIEARAQHLLGVLGLANRIDDPIVGFSKGMRQKVVLSVALLPDPDVFVLDEPLSGLDAETTQLVKEFLGVLAESGKAVLYCSHLLDIVEKVASDILILRAGKLEAHGTLAELRAKDAQQGDLEGIFRAVTEASDPAELARRLLGNSVS